LFSRKDHEDPCARLDTLYDLCATMRFDARQEKATEENKWISVAKSKPNQLE